MLDEAENSLAYFKNVYAGDFKEFDGKSNHYQLLNTICKLSGDTEYISEVDRKLNAIAEMAEKRKLKKRRKSQTKLKKKRRYDNAMLG